MEKVNVGMATCTKKEFFAGSNLSFMVLAKVVLVLDRQNVDTGQIIGVMCEHDVLCPSLLEQDWVMLSEGSWVRHPKLRKGRIRLRRDGWVAVRHPSYGELLSIFPSGRVRALFEAGGFAAVPAIKLSKTSQAAGVDKPSPAARAAATLDVEATSVGGGVDDLPLLQEEPLDKHLKACAAQHWEVVHDEAHVRSSCARGGQLLCTLRARSIVCLGSGDTSAPASPDGRWARCIPGARIWTSAEAKIPRLVLGSQEDITEAFLLKQSEEHDIIKRIDPPPKPVAKPKPRERTVEHDPHIELRRRLATEDYWTVVGNDAVVRASRSEDSRADVVLRSDDILFTSREESFALWHDYDQEWLMLPIGAQVYRDDKWHHNIQAQGFVLLEADGRKRIQRGREPDTTAVMRVVAGFGEPWVVEQDQVMAYPQPSVECTPVGTLLRGDVVGIKRRVGAWVELACDADLRSLATGAGGHGAVVSASSVRRFTELEVRSRFLDDAARWAASARSNDVRQVVQGDPNQHTWVLAEDATSRQLLLRCPSPPDSAAQSARLLGEERRDVYREVLQLCHQRIYLENLKGLWEGDASKLPPLEALEAKLFDERCKVVHVSKEGRFCGGAVIKELSVKATHTQGAGPSQASICYIDMCATKPGSHAGADIFELLVSMKYACIACHPILLQSTVSFWQSRGMRRFDVTSEKDCDDFRKQVLEHTGGITCGLSDVQDCLPSSKLPLFIFVSELFVKPRARISDML